MEDTKIPADNDNGNVLPEGEQGNHIESSSSVHGTDNDNIPANPDSRPDEAARLKELQADVRDQDELEKNISQQVMPSSLYIYIFHESFQGG